ncbi:chemotaxis protein MotA [Syntrophus gentianae]|uniref:Chemotaxis protein MotA n=1 Tax=Syntrophus gentianae TaxID=43775 RepID=A0A1H7X030_9BACT|nr:flagellar motor stator protein MotA [Syntrophus gentianae]SEM26479.1 chemotaxis protein MotA [Syntrophus gentianae]
MFAIIGIAVVLSTVIGGYLLEHGNLAVLIQPAEMIIIFGAATGALLISSPSKVVKAVLKAVSQIFGGKTFEKKDYTEALLLLNGIFYKIRQQGLVSIESDVDNPKESALFNQYPAILKNTHAVDLITDTLRTVMTTTIAPHELDALIDQELEIHFEEMMQPAKSVNFVADALPGLGIVAAVLGVVLTMGKISEPPEELGKCIGAALVGTFLGVLMCYGFVGPMGKNIEHRAGENVLYLTVLKVALLAFIGGSAPKVAVEFGRRVIPAGDRPSFAEIEEALRQHKG